MRPRTVRDSETHCYSDSVQRMFRLQEAERGHYSVRELRLRYERMVQGVAGDAAACAGVGAGAGSNNSSRGGTPGEGGAGVGAAVLPASPGEVITPSKRVVPQSMEEVRLGLGVCSACIYIYIFI